MTTIDPRISHMSYELETMRQRVRRTIRQESDLLELGLTALRRGRPHVTEDRIELVLEHLQQLLTEIDAPRKDVTS